MKEDVKSNYVFQIYEKENIPTALVDSGKKVKNEYKMNVKFLGLFPVKSVNVKRVPDISLYPGGTSIGVKLSTKGVLVVALSDIEVDGKKVSSPAAQSGIMVGDSILTVDGKT